MLGSVVKIVRNIIAVTYLAIRIKYVFNFN